MRTRRRRLAIVRRVRGGFRALRIRPLTGLVVVGVCLLLSLYLVRFATIAHLRGEIARAGLQERRALVAQGELRDRLGQKDNPAAIEDLARKLLGLVKPGEEKIIFIEGK